MIVVPIQQVRAVAAGFSIPIPTLHYRLNEASGNALEVVSGLDMTAFNSPGAASGVIGGARSFNGSNQYFSRADNAAFQLATTETIAFWAYLNSKASDHLFFGRGVGSNPNNQDFTLTHNAVDDKFRISIRIGASTFFAAEASTHPVSTATWYCVAVKWDGTNLYWSINGAAWSGTAFTSTPQTTGTAAPYIGALPSYVLPAYHDGRLDALTVWKGISLSDAEIADFYNSGAGREFNGTIWV